MQTDKNIMLGCGCCSMSRRNFLAAGCAACAGAMGALSIPSVAHAAPAGNKKLNIKVLYSLHAEKQPRPDWPNVGFNFGPVMEQFNSALSAQFPQYAFTSAMAKDEGEAKALLKEDKAAKIDGYIVFQMNAWNQVIQSVAATDKPVLYADFQFGGSGGFLVYNAAFLRKKANVGFVASSKMDDFLAAARCFEVVANGGSAADFAAAVTRARVDATPKAGDLGCAADAVQALSPEECLKRFKELKILAVRDQNAGPADAWMGIPVEMVAFEEVNAAWKAADKDESRAIAEMWAKNAAVVQDVSAETLETSAAMYLGMKDVLKKHGAQAITINCLGGFYGGHIHAYPCLGFHELCNEGLVGACECDIASTTTMLAFSTLAQGRPGYISDPVIDTSKRQIIYAHCVASKKAFGPQGATNPYEILTHSEDRQGASVRSIMPIGYMTTSLQVSPQRKEILFHQGKAVANDPDDRACRTKLCAEPVGDIEKLFTQWDQWGWHRVTFYGDLKAPVFALADAMGYKIVEEA